MSDLDARPLGPRPADRSDLVAAGRPVPTGRVRHLLAGPASPGTRVVGWIIASAIFAASLVVWYGLVHGPTGPISPTGDVWESATPAIAIEHGTLSCAYPAQASSSVPPLYPLIAAGILAATGSRPAIGPWVHSTPCPGGGPNGTRYPEWSFLLTGLVAWPVLLAGYALVLRAAGRTRTHLELLGAWVIAAMPTLAGAYVQYFHPEDVLAVGLVLSAVGMSLEQRWLAAGVCLGLACCSKQYAVLAAIALVVGAPRGARTRLVAAVAGTAGGLLLVLTPLMGAGLWASSFGAYATITNGPTLVGWLGLHGVLRTAVARGLPLVGAAVLAAGARRRLGPALLSPAPLLGLVTGSLVLRLVFEVNLYSYYLLAVGTCLVVLDVVGRRIRPMTLAWLVTTNGLFPPAFDVLVPIQEHAPQLVQAGVVLGALALSLPPVLRREPATEPDAQWPAPPAGAPLRLRPGPGLR